MSESDGERPQEGEKKTQEDIFGDDLSISSDEDKKMEDVESDDEEIDKKQKKKKKKRIIDDDDDEDNVERYGDDNQQEEDDDEDKDKGVGSDKDEEDEDQDQVGGANAAAAAAAAPMPETRIDVKVPKISTDLGKDLHFVKLPNFLSVECRPFDANTYEDEIEDEDSLDEEGRARLKLKVENTMRWRQGFDEDGKAVRESNARLVKWSDGSMSLHLGSEIFDVYKQPLQGDYNHLFIRQGTGLQGQAVFRTKLSFRPHSTESFTHQKLTRNMADRSNKAAGIKVISQVGRDPELNRYKRVKEEEERLRAAMRRDSKQKRIRERAGQRGLNAGHLEGDYSDDEDGTVSLAAIKNKYKRGGVTNRGGNVYSSDDDASDDSDVDKKAKRLEAAKVKNPIKESDSENEAASGKSSRSGSRASSRSNSRSSSRSRSRSKSRSRSRSRSRSVSGSPASAGGSSRKSSPAPGSASGSDSD